MQTVPSFTRETIFKFYRFLIKVTENWFNLRLLHTYRDIVWQAGFNKIIVIDVGAHHGETIDFFLGHFDIESILAFEPSRRSFQIVEAKHRDTPKVTLYNMAVGKTKTVKVFYEMAVTEMSSLIAPDNIGLRNRLKKQLLHTDLAVNGSHEVPVTTLDELQTRWEFIDRDIICKIDTEGYELSALLGAQSFLSSENRIVLQIEIHRDKTRKYLEPQIDELLLNQSYQRIAERRHYMDPTVVDVIYVSKEF